MPVNTSTESQIDLIAARLRGGVIDRTTALKQIRVMLTTVEPAEFLLGYAVQHQDDMAKVLAGQREKMILQDQHVGDMTIAQDHNLRRIAAEDALARIVQIAQGTIIP